jgi:hypothetical protein
MRLAALESVITLCLGYYLVDVSDEGWTAASLESRWFKAGDDLARNYFQVEEGVLVDRQGNLVFQHR